ncbi:hypothetical protein OAH05_02180 [bacterium]|jgi:hypothetical protein|nr:hypothetical protein [Planctomicrobium sp.]MDB4802716.1 hypothetical protein [bacterium]
MEPTQHPVWNAFKNRLAGKAGWTEDKILDLWTDFVNGMELQKQFIAKDKTNNTHIAKKTSNKHYEGIATKLKEKLVAADGKMALWCGGYGVSEYARYKGYTTLESTVLGGAFDQLYEQNLKPNNISWDVIAPLWNALSEMYVKMGKSAVTVFIRVHDPMSVLLRKEIPAVAGKNNFINRTFADLEDLSYDGLSWRVVFGDGAKEQLKELNEKGELVDSYGFISLMQARKVLKAYLAKNCDGRTNFAAKAMKTD